MERIAASISILLFPIYWNINQRAKYLLLPIFTSSVFKW